MWQVTWRVARKVCARQNEVEASPGSETVNNVKDTGWLFEDLGISVPGGTLKGRRRKLRAVPARALQSRL